MLWSGEFWRKNYYVSAVGMHGDETTLADYVRKQSNDKNNKALHQHQLNYGGKFLFLCLAAWCGVIHSGLEPLIETVIPDRTNS